ncbi:MAG: RpiB/LacA/LacB family sugar-phosphate isomerase [Candidatus Komeilibacteria bacterium]
MVEESKNQTIYIGSDHAGFSLKQILKQKLTRAGLRVIDVSGGNLQPTDDYPIIAYAVAQSVAGDPGTVGIIVCGNAQGVAMVANKVAGVRAAVGYSVYGVKTSRSDDDSNVLCLAGRVLKLAMAWRIVQTWLQTPYARTVRFQRRLQQVLAIEQQQKPLVDIIPSILVASVTEFKARVHKIEHYFSLAQVDVADGDFVPNSTAIDWTTIDRTHSEMSFDLHLMVRRPDVWLKRVKKTDGLYRVFWHLESDVKPEEMISLIRRKGLSPALALRPETAVGRLRPYLSQVDAILLLAVEPGFNGGKFLPTVIDRIRQLRRLDKRLPIVIDGGINLKTAKLAIDAGATSLVIGSFLQHHADWEKIINQLRRGL